MHACILDGTDQEVPVWRQDPLGGKNCSSFTLLQVFQVQIFLNLIVYTQTKLRGSKTGLICSGSTRESFNEP